MGIAYNPKIVTDGLVLCLDAANQKSYPGSGTTWSDLSGNGNNGTLVNGVGYSADNKGIMVFDGANDYGYINESATTKPTNSITVSTFIYPTLSSYTNVRLLGDWHQSGDYDRWIFYATGTTISWYMVTTSTGAGGAGWTIVPNQWVSLVGRYDGVTQDFFVNGNFFSSRSVTGVMRSGDGNRPIRFGQQGNFTGTASAGNPFQGNMSNITMYNRALTAAEIQQNFNATRSRYGI